VNRRDIESANREPLGALRLLPISHDSRLPANANPTPISLSQRNTRSFSAILTSSARDPACILCIT
jgi:hypothetical protein